VVGIMLPLRDVPAPSPFEKHYRDFAFLSRVLHADEPAANRIANTVAVSFVEERERVIRQQQDSFRGLSTPVLAVRERLLVLPIIGVLDGDRADQLTEQLVRGIRTITRRSSSSISPVPGRRRHRREPPVQTVDTSRLRGTSVIITELPHDRPNARDRECGSEQDPPPR